MTTTRATAYKIELAADLQRWRVFVTVAEMGSLTRAALALDSNQSLLSRQVNALERDCGARLFVRTGRGVALSDLGQRLLPQVRDLLAAAQQLEQDIHGEAREPAGRVTLGSLPSLGPTLVAPLFAAVHRELPQVQLKILEGSSGQVEEWLSDARVDIAILYRYGSSLPEGEQSLALVDSWLIGHPGDRRTAGAEVRFADLDGLPFILPSAPNGLRTALDQLARQERVNLAPVIEADSLPLQKSMVADERLYAVLPLHAVWQDVREGRLQAARIVQPGLQRWVSMAQARAKGPTRAVSAVVALIGRISAEMASRGLWRPGEPALRPQA